MKRLYPVETEALVLLHEPEIVLERISAALDRPFIHQDFPMVITGSAKDDGFRISVRTRRQQFFMPVISGMIEPTSTGALLFITYSLYPGTKALLTFWTLMLPLISFPLFLQYGNIWIIIGMLLFTVAIHFVARETFRIHTKIAKAVVRDLVS